ncbi:SigE family RNA polymerase sigma factor [soil metagenome]
MGATFRAAETTVLVMSLPQPVGPPELAECYRTARTELVRLGFLLSGSHEVAEDAVQAAFADAQRRWNTIDNHRAYLRRAVTSRIHDTYRRAQRIRRLPGETTALIGIAELDETWHEVLALPQRQREVVVLRFYEDMTLADIASLLDRNPATVRSDLHRALTHLRRTFHA